MSWMKKLYETYEAVSKQNLDNTDTPLTPVGHTMQNAHITIVLNAQGEFQTAYVVPAKTTIILPATEASENRTSGEGPHPFADKIQYVAKDYAIYGGKKKSYFSGYLKQLQEWCNSPYAHPKVQAVCHYVQKGTLVADLVRVGIFPLDSKGQILGKWDSEKEAPMIFSVLPKTKGEIEFGSALVRWCVETTGDKHNETWTDKTIQQSWINYISNNTSQKGFCLILGKECVISSMHPAKLRHTGDKAKLISANDTEGYTFRGRFEQSEEAASVSADVSAKSHSALRWLIARQGIRNGDQVTIVWAISGKEVPSPLRDSLSDIDWDNPDINAIENEVEMQPENEGERIDWTINIGRAAAQIIKKKLRGYQAELKAHEQISLLMLDSATPGRMALTYYQEFLSSDYFSNLDAWIDDISWYQRHSIEKESTKKSDKKQIIWAFLPPSPYAIYETIYGKRGSDILKKQLYARLLPIIAGGHNVPIPYDLVQKSFQAACNPSGYENWEWQRNIGVACALYKGWCARHQDLSQRRTYSMSLDKENRSRDYLYGRLLAVAEGIESYALYLAEEKRATTAERYMQRFAEHPFATWRNIELALKPYQDRLRSRNKDTGNQAIGEIMELFQANDFTCDNKLSGEFLLGYHCQKMETERQIAERKAAKSAKSQTNRNN
ncbi:type I-C CRISPR-associated protein Cas8c/Csd1 [Pasteurellaceae bacterium LIM206]|nr:type I-C CRISPR-associated protein Cas8c/Csd1 [Pasteurellaceae bacterium LIM206]